MRRNNDNKKYRRLSYCDRQNIQGGLYKGFSIRKIADVMGVSPSTILREIKMYMISKEKHLSVIPCPDLASGKFIVCNQCKKTKRTCTYDRRFYDCDEAQKAYLAKMNVAFAGPRLPMSRFTELDGVFTAYLRKGHSVEHIYHRILKDPDDVSVQSIRRYIRQGLFVIKNVSLRRARRYARQAKKPGNYDKIKNANRLFGRTIEDFVRAYEGHPEAIVLQFDSVEGLKTDKTRILTMMITREHLQCLRKYDVSNAHEEALNLMSDFVRAILKHAGDRPLLCLTDNGCEFSTFEHLEDIDARVKTFFARPNIATDKSQCERNHELVRYMIPKHHSLDQLSDAEVTFVANNVNSYGRESLQWKSPCESTAEAFGADLVKNLGLTSVPAEQVDLSPII